MLITNIVVDDELWKQFRSILALEGKTIKEGIEALIREKIKEPKNG